MRKTVMILAMSLFPAVAGAQNANGGFNYGQDPGFLQHVGKHTDGGYVDTRSDGDKECLVEKKTRRTVCHTFGEWRRIAGNMANGSTR